MVDRTSIFRGLYHILSVAGRPIGGIPPRRITNRLGAAGYAGCLAFALTAGWDMAKDWGRTHVPEWVLKARHRWRSRRPPSPGRQAPEEMVGR